MTCLRATTLICLYFDCKDSGIFEYAGYKNCFLGCKFYFYSVNKTTSNTSFLFFTPIQIPFFYRFSTPLTANQAWTQRVVRRP